MRTPILASLMALAATTSAVAQEAAADWDVINDPARKLLTASTTFSNGITIGLRCMDGRYDALIAGLPPAAPEAVMRTVSLQFGDAEAQTREWYVSVDRAVAVSDLPARTARQLREGGLLHLRVREAGPEGRRVRYDLDLPVSNAQIDRTLSACGRPTTDPRDTQLAGLERTGLPATIDWQTPPRPNYPQGMTYDRGFASVTCLARADGRLGECVVESEYPLDGGFGREALSATRHARLQDVNTPGAAIEPRMIVYRTVFRKEGRRFDVQTGSRIPQAE